MIYPSGTISYGLPLLMAFLLSCSAMQAQVVFWTEAFSNNCANNCGVAAYNGPNGSWSSANTGTNNASANVWYVSGAENGEAAGNCGTAGADPSLHLGSTTLGDIGAAYDASRTTNKRAQSPVINCTGRTGITLSFNYIENGEGATDDCIVEYFNGTTWTTLVNPGKTTTCGSGQGEWTAFSTALPASADNNANVRIGFRWTNNNVSGTDPSFAVDDISISCTGGANCTVLPIELLSFSAEPAGDKVKLDWVTASETNNDLFIIERTVDGIKFTETGAKDGAGTSRNLNEYVLYDEKPLPGVSYYRIKQVDFNGDFSYSQLAVVEREPELDTWFDAYLLDESSLFIILDDEPEELIAEIIDISGRIVIRQEFREDAKQHLLNISTLQKGLYFIRMSGNARQGIKKFVK